MKVVVTGAAGMMSLSALLYLLEQEDVSQVVAADIQEDKLKERVTALGDKRLVARFIDLADVKGSAKVFKGNDIVINCAYQGYITDKEFVDYELLTAKAALEAGANYICLGGAPPTPELLSPALSAEFEKRGLLAIPGMGAAPGSTEIMATYAINRLDRTETVDMFSVYYDLVPAEEHSRPLAPGHSMGGFRFIYCVDSAIYEDGEVQYFPPRSHPETVVFKEPIGPLTVASTPSAAAIALSRCFPDIRRITYRMGVDPKMIFLRDLGLFNNEPINVQGQMVSPWEVLMTLIRQLAPETKKPPDIVHEQRAIVKGEAAGKKVKYDISARPGPGPWKKFLEKGGVPGTSPTTGVCIAVTAMMLCRGQTKGKGVLPPALCIPPEQFIDEYAKAGMKIEIDSNMVIGE